MSFHRGVSEEVPGGATVVAAPDQVGAVVLGVGVLVVGDSSRSESSRSRYRSLCPPGRSRLTSEGCLPRMPQVSFQVLETGCIAAGRLELHDELQG